MPTEWRNARGKSKWQPTLASGERLSYGVFYGGPMSGEYREKKWLVGSVDSMGRGYPQPALYGRRKAERIERREQKRRDRNEYDETYREVRDES